MLHHPKNVKEFHGFIMMTTTVNVKILNFGQAAVIWRVLAIFIGCQRAKSLISPIGIRMKINR